MDIKWTNEDFPLKSVEQKLQCKWDNIWLSLEEYPMIRLNHISGRSLPIYMQNRDFTLNLLQSPNTEDLIERTTNHIIEYINKKFKASISLDGYNVRDTRDFFFKSHATWKNKIMKDKDNIALDFFKRDIQTNTTGDYHIVSYTDKYSSTNHTVYLCKDKKIKILSGDEFEFKKMLDPSLYKNGLIIEKQKKSIFRVTTIPNKYKVYIPEDMYTVGGTGINDGSDGIIKVDIIEKTDTKIVIDIQTFFLMNPIVPIKCSVRYIVTFSSMYGVELKEEDIEPADWLNQCHMATDLQRHPNNKDIHPMLSDTPMYENEDIFITSKGNIFISTTWGWLLTAYDIKSIMYIKDPAIKYLQDKCKEANLISELRK